MGSTVDSMSKASRGMDRKTHEEVRVGSIPVGLAAPFAPANHLLGELLRLLGLGDGRRDALVLEERGDEVAEHEKTVCCRARQRLVAQAVTL